MRRIVSWAVFLGVICGGFMTRGLTSIGARAANSASARVGPQAVWKPGTSLLASIRAKCGAAGAQAGECFAREMKSAGASSEAVAFSKSLPDGNGYLRGFRGGGRLDIAYIEYFLRANETEGVLLVNGEPAMIDVDDQKYIPQDEMRKNADYVALAKQYPNVSIWPGDRYSMKDPAAISSAGGQEFDVEYLLQDGCDACARVGNAVVSFVFDNSGRFQGTHVLRVRPMQGKP